jgi:hypothetical protein
MRANLVIPSASRATRPYGQSGGRTYLVGPVTGTVVAEVTD